MSTHFPRNAADPGFQASLFPNLTKQYNIKYIRIKLTEV